MMSRSTVQRHLDILRLKGVEPGPDFTALVAEKGLEMVYAGNTTDGMALLRLLVDRCPDDAAANHALGTALSRTGDFSSALPHHRHAVALAPDNPMLLYNLGFALEKSGEHEEAEQHYLAAWRLDAGYDKAVVGYARMLTARQQFGRAVSVLREALRHSPGSRELLAAFANALIFAGEPERALLYYRMLYGLAPDDRKTVANFLYSLLMVREISPDVAAEELEAWSDAPSLLRAVALSSRQLASLEARQVADYHRSAGKRIEGGTAADDTGWLRRRDERRRLRIGYLSSDLYNHPMGYLMQGVLPNHDRSQFEVFVFSPFAERDGLTALLKEAAEHWIVLDAADRKGAAGLIREARPDILIELSGHTGDNWLDICAGRLAPIQASWGGYPSTSGLSAIDYIVADPVSLPPQDEPYYAERPLRIPRGYACFIPPADVPAPASLPATQNGFVTFGSFLTLHKLSSDTVALWSRVLRALPESRLYLKARALGDPEVVEAVLRKFEREQVGRERIIVAGGSPRLEMMAEYRLVDICLDPVPYQGGVTILEAAWMGVPTLLRRGSRPPFIRHGENYLVQLGLADWIAESDDEYVRKAAASSSDLTGLAILRSRLRQQMAGSPICDTVGFTRDLEAAFEHAWSESSADDQPPERLLPIS